MSFLIGAILGFCAYPFVIMLGKKLFQKTDETSEKW